MAAQVKTSHPQDNYLGYTLSRFLIHFYRFIIIFLLNNNEINLHIVYNGYQKLKVIKPESAHTRVSFRCSR